MKSERRPGCACFSASAASSIFRQNAKRVAIAGAGPMSHSDLTVVLRRRIGPWMGFEIRAVAREGFSKHPRIRATDDGSERISARGTRVRRPAFEVGSRYGGGLGCDPREGPAHGGRAHRGPRIRHAL